MLTKDSGPENEWKEIKFSNSTWLLKICESLNNIGTQCAIERPY